MQPDSEATSTESWLSIADSLNYFIKFQGKQGFLEGTNNLLLTIGTLKMALMPA
jgi:hypothetical protein